MVGSKTIDLIGEGSRMTFTGIKRTAGWKRERFAGIVLHDGLRRVHNAALLKSRRRRFLIFH